MSPALLSRRFFLGRVASAGAAAGIATTAAVASPLSAEQRARLAWEELCAAMRELAADADGWVILGAGERWEKDHPNQRGGPFLNLRTTHRIWQADDRLKQGGMWIERHGEVSL